MGNIILHSWWISDGFKGTARVENVYYAEKTWLMSSGSYYLLFFETDGLYVGVGRNKKTKYYEGYGIHGGVVKKDRRHTRE